MCPRSVSTQGLCAFLRRMAARFACCAADAPLLLAASGLRSMKHTKFSKAVRAGPPHRARHLCCDAVKQCSTAHFSTVTWWLGVQKRWAATLANAAELPACDLDPVRSIGTAADMQLAERCNVGSCNACNAVATPDPWRPARHGAEDEDAFTCPGTPLGKLALRPRCRPPGPLPPLADVLLAVRDAPAAAPDVFAPAAPSLVGSQRRLHASAAVQQQPARTKSAARQP